MDSLRQVLAQAGYANGYVTIDASDWYVNGRLIKRIQEVGLDEIGDSRKQGHLGGFRAYYLEHILDRAKFYERLSYELHGRHIRHTLLLHHNLTSALFLGDLVDRFRAEGWEVVDAGSAYEDPIYRTVPRAEFAGESLIYSLAKQSGRYADQLRYPAEDGRYEEARMDSLGL